MWKIRATHALVGWTWLVCVGAAKTQQITILRTGLGRPSPAADLLLKKQVKSFVLIVFGLRIKDDFYLESHG